VHELQLMAEQGVNMLHRALTAFIARDLMAARSIPREDDRVDELYKKFDREILNRMIADPSIIDRANYLIWAAHNLERMADRVINICERILFVVTGELREFDVEDDVISKQEPPSNKPS
jgi:phosphate transport system protein